MLPAAVTEIQAHGLSRQCLKLHSSLGQRHKTLLSAMSGANYLIDLLSCTIGEGNQVVLVCLPDLINRVLLAVVC